MSYKYPKRTSAILSDSQSSCFVRSKQNLVDVDVVRLARGVGHGAGERVGGDRNLRVEFLIRSAAAGSVTLFGNSVATAPGKITVVRIL
jgi:hypothetical protein